MHLPGFGGVADRSLAVELIRMRESQIFLVVTEGISGGGALTDEKGADEVQTFSLCVYRC